MVLQKPKRTATTTATLASFLVASSTLVGNSFAFTASSSASLLLLQQPQKPFSSSSPTRVWASRYDSTQQGGCSDNNDDVEAVRQKLEHLVQEDAGSASSSSSLSSSSQQQNNNNNPKKMGDTNNDSSASSSSSSSSEANLSPFNFFELLFGGSRSETNNNKEKQQQPSPALSARRQQHHRQKQRDAAMDIDLSVLDYPLRQYLSLNSRKNSEFAPMAVAERDRRQAELHLLSRLADEDEDVTEHLWRLWFLEGGVEGAIRLQQVEHLMTEASSSPEDSKDNGSSNPQNPNNYNPEDNQPIQDGGTMLPFNNNNNNVLNWEDESERILLELIQEHGRAWPEPINKLATLYYMQGKLQDAKQLCRLVLSIKPWHFGALSGLVMIYSSMHQTALAKQWAAKRLPPLSKEDPLVLPEDGAASANRNRRRRLWVQIAVEQASQQLQDRIREQQEWWGPLDAHHSEQHGTIEPMLPSFADLDKIIKQTLENENGSIPNDDNNVWQ